MGTGLVEVDIEFQEGPSLGTAIVQNDILPGGSAAVVHLYELSIYSVGIRLFLEP